MALITVLPNQDEIKQYVPAIHRNMAGTTLLPFIQDAEQLDLLPHIGQAMYDDLFANPSDYTDALPYLKAVVAWFAYYRALPSLRTVVADMGLQQQNDREGTSSPANEEQYNTVLWNALRTAYDKLEVLIWNHLVPNQADYPEWTGWAGSRFAWDLFLNSPAVFQQHHPLHTPGALETWLKLRPIMRKIELYHIKPILCDDLFAELKAQIATPDDLTPENAVLLELVRNVVAARTVEEAASKLNLQLTARGGKVRTASESRYANKQPDYRDYEHLHQQETSDVALATKALTDYLKTHADTYPLWKASVCNPANATTCADPCNNAAPETYNARECQCCHTTPCTCGILVARKKGIIAI